MTNESANHFTCHQITFLRKDSFVIITIAGYKGGIGKTTTAIHLAAFFQTLAPTLFIDADENRSALSWARFKKLPFEVTTENLAPKRIMAMRPDNIVIDTKARPSTEDLQEISQSCDLLILPTTTRPMDLEVLVKTVQEIKHIETPYRVLLTMVPPTSTKISTEIKELLNSSNIPVLNSVIQRYTFVEQLPLDGHLSKDVKGEHPRKVWDQYMNAGKEILG